MVQPELSKEVLPPDFGLDPPLDVGEPVTVGADLTAGAGVLGTGGVTGWLLTGELVTEGLGVNELLGAGSLTICVAAGAMLVEGRLGVAGVCEPGATPSESAGAALMRRGIEVASAEMLGGDPSAVWVRGLAARPIKKKQAKTAAHSEASTIIPEGSIRWGVHAPRTRPLAICSLLMSGGRRLGSCRSR